MNNSKICGDSFQETGANFYDSVSLAKVLRRANPSGYKFPGSWGERGEDFPPLSCPPPEVLSLDWSKVDGFLDYGYAWLDSDTDRITAPDPHRDHREMLRNANADEVMKVLVAHLVESVRQESKNRADPELDEITHIHEWQSESIERTKNWIISLCNGAEFPKANLYEEWRDRS